MKKTAIIDYGMGNLDSVARAVEECGGSPFITKETADLKQADYIILPGVGAFPVGMRNLRHQGLDKALEESVLKKEIPFLGICLGMQLLAKKGWEVEETKGLGWIEGEIRRLETTFNKERIPHMGWDEVIFCRDSPLFSGIPSGKDFYFVHSYHFACGNEQDVIARTPYCNSFISAVSKRNIFGVQFHPEKSQEVGLKVIKNFLNF